MNIFIMQLIYVFFKSVFWIKLPIPDFYFLKHRTYI
jgi:hypothetical protein